MSYLIVGQASIVQYGPFLDKDDGVTPDASLASSMTIYASLSGGALTLLSSTATPVVYDRDGFYRVPIPAADVGSTGILRIQTTDAAVHLPVWNDFQVVTQAEYDELGSSSGTLIWSYGGPDSNSYVSITDANSFITTAMIASSAWSDATAAQRLAALMMATEQIDSRQYRGYRYYDEQKLEFPRQLEEVPGWPFNLASFDPSNTETIVQKRMKEDIKRATCYQAVWNLRNSGRNIHVERQAQGIKFYSETTGPLKESFGYGASSKGVSMDPDALMLLSEWLQSGRRVSRG